MRFSGARLSTSDTFPTAKTNYHLKRQIRRQSGPRRLQQNTATFRDERISQSYDASSSWSAYTIQGIPTLPRKAFARAKRAEGTGSQSSDTPGESGCLSASRPTTCENRPVAHHVRLQKCEFDAAKKARRAEHGGRVWGGNAPKGPLISPTHVLPQQVQFLQDHRGEN